MRVSCCSSGVTLRGAIEFPSPAQRACARVLVDGDELGPKTPRPSAAARWGPSPSPSWMRPPIGGEMRASGRRFDGVNGISVRCFVGKTTAESESNGSVPLVADRGSRPPRRDRCAGRAAHRAPAPVTCTRRAANKAARVSAGPSSAAAVHDLRDAEVEHLHEVRGRRAAARSSLSQVLSALSDAHKPGHPPRLKPENILNRAAGGRPGLREGARLSGIAKIMDGQRRRGPALTRAGLVCGHARVHVTGASGARCAARPAQRLSTRWA